MATSSFAGWTTSRRRTFRTAEPTRATNLALTPFFAPTYGWSITANVATIITPTLTNEFQFGYTVNGIPGDAPPAGSPYYRSVSNINIPLLYPDANISGVIPNFNFSGIPRPAAAPSSPLSKVRLTPTGIRSGTTSTTSPRLRQPHAQGRYLLRIRREDGERLQALQRHDRLRA